jgi:hypothetical protein
MYNYPMLQIFGNLFISTVYSILRPSYVIGTVCERLQGGFKYIGVCTSLCDFCKLRTSVLTMSLYLSIYPRVLYLIVPLKGAQV